MNLCYLISDRIHRARVRKGRVEEALRSTGDAAYWDWQYQTSEEYFAKFFDLRASLADANVIDVGCGLGGRTCYLASQGVRSIVGTDTNHQEIDRAICLARDLGGNTSAERVSFRKVQEKETTDSREQADVVLLVDSLEHVREPTAMLNLAHEMLKPGGVCYFSTWGWYHHQASHVGSIVPIPFSTVLFSDRQILGAVRRIVDQPYYQRTQWDSDPPSKRWQDCQSLHDRPGEYLNKYTIADFRKSMQASKFTQWELKAQGFSSTRRPLLAVFNFLSRVPVIQELYHSALFGRLTKDSDRAEAGANPDDVVAYKEAG